MKLVKSRERSGGGALIEQMEMGNLGGIDSVLAVKAVDLDLKVISELCAAERVSAIFDIRLAPYLNFGYDSRESFWSLLREKGVDYVGCSAFVEGLSLSGEADSRALEERVRQEIKKGNLLFISDHDPRSDAVFSAFHEFLTAQGLRVFSWSQGRKMLLLRASE